MSGFILGTGSGVLASCLVYYTLSTALSESTASLRSDLSFSTQLLNSSLSDTPPPAPVALVGPLNPHQPKFGDILRQRWNRSVSLAFTNLRETDWTSVGAGAYEAGREVVERLSGTEAGQEALKLERQAEEKLRAAPEQGRRALGGMYEGVKETGRALDERITHSAVPGDFTPGAPGSGDGAPVPVPPGLAERVKGAWQGLKTEAQRTGEALDAQIQESRAGEWHTPGAVEDAEAKAESAMNSLKRGAERLKEEVKETGRRMDEKIREGMAGHVVQPEPEAKRAQEAASGVGITLVRPTSGLMPDMAGVRGGESFTGGSTAEVTGKRAAEIASGRLV